MALLTPAIGASGIYKLKAPFTNLQLPNVSYTCMAVRKLSDIIALGIDPLDTYYKTVSLNETAYKNDLASDACIISLQSTGGAWLYVPNSYIESYPQVNGVPYNQVALMVLLGVLPDSVDLTYIKNKLISDIGGILGITPTVQTVVTSNKTLVAQQTHIAAETARQAKITKSGTDYSENIKLRESNAALLQKVAALETYIKQHNL